MYKTIKESIKINGKKYLLISPYDNKNITTKQLSKYLMKTFKEINPHISSTVIRKIYLSEFLKNDTKLELKEKIASNFGHSVGTMEKYYVKHDD